MDISKADNSLAASRAAMLTCTIIHCQHLPPFSCVCGGACLSEHECRHTCCDMQELHEELRQKERHETEEHINTLLQVETSWLLVSVTYACVHCVQLLSLSGSVAWWHSGRMPDS